MRLEGVALGTVCDSVSTSEVSVGTEPSMGAVVGAGVGSCRTDGEGKEVAAVCPVTVDWVGNEELIALANVVVGGGTVCDAEVNPSEEGSFEVTTESAEWQLMLVSVSGNASTCNVYAARQNTHKY